jgi:hypothetical protein
VNLPFVASLSRIFSPFVVLEHHVVSLLMATVEAKRVCLPKRRNGARCGSCFTYSTRQSHQRLGRRRCGAQNFGTCSMDVSVTVQPGISDLVHDDLVTELAVRVKQVITASSPSSNESSCRIASRKLRRLQKSLAAIASIVSDTSTPVCYMCLLHQYKERTNDINRDLIKTRDDVHRTELDDDNSLFKLQEIQ